MWRAVPDDLLDFSRLMGLGAVMSVTPQVVRGGQEAGGTFRATGLDHIALDVRDVPRSRDFYVKHLGLEVIRDGGGQNCSLGRTDGFFLTLSPFPGPATPQEKGDRHRPKTAGASPRFLQQGFPDSL